MTMLRSLVVALGAAVVLFAFSALGEAPGGAAVRAALSVALGVSAASLVYGEATFAAVAVGAVSPLAFRALEPMSLAGAAAVLALLWLAPRFVLAETPKKLTVLAVVSLAAAAIAGIILAAYVAAPLASHAASCVFAGSCLSLVGIVVPLPSPETHALRASAAIVDGLSKGALLAAADAFESSRWHGRAAGEARKWRKLVRLSDRRAALERVSGPRAADLRAELDAQIATAAGELLPTPVAMASRSDVSTPIATAPANAVSVDTPPVAAVATVTAALDAALEKIEEGETLVEESRSIPAIPHREAEG
jgi:hypothetical protein